MPTLAEALIAGGYLLLGTGLVVRAFEGARRPALPSDSVARLPEGKPRLRVVKGEDPAAPPRTRTYRVKSIEERVAHIRRLACKGAVNGRHHLRVTKVLTRKCKGVGGSKHWCTPEKDWRSESVAVFAAMRDANSPLAFRYTMDPLPVDLFKDVRFQETAPGGDCDDASAFLSASLLTVGHPAEFVVMQVKGKSTWSHISVRTPVDPHSLDKGWLYLDPSMAKPAGWAPPGLLQVLATGKPHGMIVRAEVFPVQC